MITIGLPFYNNQDTLEDAIKSILNQTYTNWELILANDGSTDGSLQIAKKMAALDPRIKITGDNINRKISYRLNQICDMAQGEYLVRMDSDDMMMPDRIEKQMNVLLEDTTIDVIDTAAYIINEKSEPIGIRGMDDITGWTKKDVLTKGLMFHPTVIAKTAWYKKNRYNEKYNRSEDLELWCRTFDDTVFSRVYEPLYIYREGRVNISNYLASAQTTRAILRRYYKGIISSAAFFSEMIKSYSKSSAYRLFAFFNIQHILASTRNEKLSAEQKQKVLVAMQQIHSFSSFSVV